MDGWAGMHVMRFEPDPALAVLEQARPVLEAHGTPAQEDGLLPASGRCRSCCGTGCASTRGHREPACRHRGGRASGEDRDKDVGYATDFLGWALWLRGDLAEAAAEVETRALNLAERIGETVLRDLALLTLTLTALRRHDTEAVRALLPRAFAAAREVGTKSTAASRLTCRRGLARLAGRPPGRGAEASRRDRVA